MNPTVIEPTRQDNSPENQIDISGYSAIVNPFLTTTGREVGAKTVTDLDVAALQKLWHTGLNISDMADAFNRYKLAPVRTTADVQALLGFSNLDLKSIHVTAIAFSYPVPHQPDATYRYTQYIRVRPPVPVKLGTDNTCKYIQPFGTNAETHSEPYFLCCTDTWTRVMSKEFPLYITEGECKAIALGLAGHAAIGFPGAQMFYANKKAGKGVLHPSLDPEGPRKGFTIPIQDRDIIIIPDNDFVNNKDVKTGYKNLIRNLVVAGASADRIRLVIIPPNPDNLLNNKVGIDDYLTEKLGPRWGGEETKVAHARELLNDLLANSGKYITLNEYIYAATSCIRGADRFMERFDAPNKYLAVVQASDEGRHNIWAMYNCDHYMLFPVNLSLNSTTSKVSFKDDELAVMAHETWDEGVRIAAHEGDREEDTQPEMAADYPNRVYGLVAPHLPSRFNETLIEPFPGVDVDDKCIRIQGGLINLNKCFATGVDWSRRGEWLLPPNYRWFGTGQVQVSLTNLDGKPECPAFLWTLANMFENDPVKTECLQLAFGKILLAPMFLDRNQFFAFYGTAGSGKSTITNILLHLVGEHDVAVLRGNFGGRFDTSELPGKRLVLFPENEDGSHHHFTKEMATTVKKITGRDMLVCEKKGQQPYSFRADAEILIVGNAPPTIEMDEEAFKRRAVFCKAVHKIATPDYGKSKEVMMGSELPGIFLWALEGAAKLAAGMKFETPQDCYEDIFHAVIQTNLEKRFVAQMVVEKSGKRVTMTELTEAFRVWLRHNRLAAREPGWGKIAGAIRDRFDDKYKSEPGKDDERNSTRLYRGLALAELLY